MNQEVIYGLLIPFAKETPIYNNEMKPHLQRLLIVRILPKVVIPIKNFPRNRQGYSNYKDL
jgi:hypothetical protein